MTRRGWLLFAAMSVIWGIPYLLVKVAVEELSAPALVLCRCGLAAVLLGGWAAARGELLPVLRLWRPLLLFTVLEMTGPWLLIAHAEQTLSSSLTGLLIAAVPLVAAVASRLVGEQDRLDAVRVVGLLVGIGGVAALLGLDVGGRGELLAVGAVGLVVLGYGTAPLVVTARLGGVSSIAVSAWALGITALVYLPLGGRDLARTGLPSSRVVLSVVVLSLVCTVAALVLFFALIREAGPNRALVITFVNPAVAIALGVGLLHEPLTRGMLVGFPLVLLGCVLATRRARASAPVDGGGRDDVLDAPALQV